MNSNIKDDKMNVFYPTGGEVISLGEVIDWKSYDIKPDGNGGQWIETSKYGVLLEREHYDKNGDKIEDEKAIITENQEKGTTTISGLGDLTAIMWKDESDNSEVVELYRDNRKIETSKWIAGRKVAVFENDKWVDINIIRELANRSKGANGI